MKKYIISGFLVIALVFPVVAKAEDTISEDLLASLQQQINQLLEQISNLQTELGRLQGEVKKVETQIEKFTKSLQKGVQDKDVERLQEFLAQYPDVYPEGLVTGYFGPLTEKAVQKFQEKHADDVLKPYGLNKGTGFVGEKTIAKINELLTEGAGASGQVPPGLVAASERRITICHYPPGNPEARHTIVIAESALEAHLAHGDTIGPCPDDPTPIPTPTPTPCSESWNCGSWSTCVNNTQTRICTDANSCGTINLRPVLSQSCTPNPTPTPTPTPCSESWSCGSWSSCVNNTQTRICTDANNCGTINVRPALNQSCTPTPSPDTTPPVISNFQPSGTITDLTPTLSLSTDENATCKYSAIDQSFGSMLSTFSGVGATYHYATMETVTAGTYTYYARCQDTAGNKNTISASITFTITTTPTSLTCAGEGGKFCASKTPTEMCSGIWFDENGCCLGDCYVPEDNRCYDSDGGENYYVKGYVETEATKFVKIDNSFGVLYDTCYGDMLREYRCEEDYLPYAHITEIYGRTVDVDSTYICPNGCQDGACVDVTAFENLLKDIQSQVATVSTAVLELFNR